MSNDYFNLMTPLARHTLGRAEAVNALFNAIEVGFEKLPSADRLSQGRVTFAVDTGVSNALVASMPQTMTAYQDGAEIWVKVAATNTSGAAINVDGLGVRPIVQPNGFSLAPGDLTAGDLVGLIYDASNTRWVIFTPLRSAREAVGLANFQGEYDEDTLYTIGQSVSYLGFIFTKKSNAPAGTTPVDGSDWRAATIPPAYQEFTSSGTWTKPAGVTWVRVEAVGGGGGGAKAHSTNGAGGGSGGEFVTKIFLASELSATETVTVGAGGAGGTGATSQSGSTGGNSVFGSHITAYGGNGGTAASNGPGGELPRSLELGGNSDQNISNLVFPQAGRGGWGAVVTFPGMNAIYGGAGGGGCSLSTAGVGGDSEFGGAGGNANNSGAGQNGSAPGGGGGAAYSASDVSAGDGGAGIVRVWAW